MDFIRSTLRWHIAVNKAQTLGIEVEGHTDEDDCYVFALESHAQTGKYHPKWVRSKQIAGPVSYLAALTAARKYASEMDLPTLP